MCIIINTSSHDKPILQSDWDMEIPQHRLKDTAQVQQTLPPSLEWGLSMKLRVSWLAN